MTVLIIIVLLIAVVLALVLTVLVYLRVLALKAHITTDIKKYGTVITLEGALNAMKDIIPLAKFKSMGAISVQRANIRRLDRENV